MADHFQSTRAVRYSDIDALRGFAVLGMILVGYVGDNAYRPFWAEHADWLGYSFADFVYPLFLFVSGLSTAASLHSRGDVSVLPVIRRSFWRSCRLFCVGLFLLSASYSTPRFNLGTLQCIAIISFLTVVLAQCRNSQILALIPAMLLAYHLILQQSPAPYLEGATIPESIDNAILGKFRAEEGILPTLALVAIALFGVIVQRNRAWVGGYAGRYAYSGAAIVALGGMLQLYFESHFAAMPVLPRIASPASIVFSLSLCFILFGIVQVLSLRQTTRVLLHFLIPVGRNALALYVFAKLFQKWILNGWTVPSAAGVVTLKAWYVDFLGIASRPIGSYLYTLTIVILVVVAARTLDRRGLYWKI